MILVEFFVKINISQFKHCMYLLQFIEDVFFKKKIKKKVRVHYFALIKLYERAFIGNKIYLDFI